MSVDAVAPSKDELEVALKISYYHIGTSAVNKAKALSQDALYLIGNGALLSLPHWKLARKNIESQSPKEDLTLSRTFRRTSRTHDDDLSDLSNHSPFTRASRSWNTATMATELTVQSERAFMKQPHIFTNSKVKSKSKSVGKGGRRWYKDVGLGFRTPKTAIEGNYIGMHMAKDSSLGQSQFSCKGFRDRHRTEDPRKENGR